MEMGLVTQKYYMQEKNPSIMWDIRRFRLWREFTIIIYILYPQKMDGGGGKGREKSGPEV